MSTPFVYLQDWLKSIKASVRFTQAEPVDRDRGWTLYRVAWQGQQAGLRHVFPVPGDNYPGRRAVDRVSAEAVGLRAYAPSGIAPKLLHEGALPGVAGDYAVIYSWIEGLPLAIARASAATGESYADTLLDVHNKGSEPGRTSPLPRDLDRWWFAIHEQYRETEELRVSMPEPLRDTLNGLLQSVGADAQAHKRLWTGAALTPIHGGARHDALLATDGRICLVNWQFYGLGDPTYEVARAAWTLGGPGEEAGERFLARYLQASPDEQMGKRLTVYLRLWPFDALLDTLERAWAVANSAQKYPLGNLSALKVDALSFLYHTLQTFERDSAGIEAAQRDMQLWFLKLQAILEGRDARPDEY